MKPGSKKDRRAEFEARPGGQPSLHLAALHSVDGLLALALRDRSSGRYRPLADHESNHTTEHAVGVVVLCVVALEAWVNEIIAERGALEAILEQEDRPTLALASKDLRGKLGALLETAGSSNAGVSAEFDLLVTLRNEFTHGMPRWWDERSRPAWAEPLANQGLLGVPKDGRSYPWSHQYNTYKVAWWSCCTVEAEALRLGHAIGGVQRMLASNFSGFRRAAPEPGHLTS